MERSSEWVRARRIRSLELWIREWSDHVRKLMLRDGLMLIVSTCSRRPGIGVVNMAELGLEILSPRA